MKITVDWNAVVAMVSVGAAFLSIARLFIRDEIRKAVNGRFDKVQKQLDEGSKRLDFLEARGDCPLLKGHNLPLGG